VDPDLPDETGFIAPYDQGMIVDGPTGAGAKVRAARARDGSFAFVYSPRGARFTVDRSIPPRRAGSTAGRRSASSDARLSHI